MLSEEPNDMELTIFKNEDKLFSKNLSFTQQKKNIFANLKESVKTSDLIRFTFGLK